VQQLLLINEALTAGYRAGDVVPLSLDQLVALLKAAGVGGGAEPDGWPQWFDGILAGCRSFDRSALTELLHQDAMMLGIPAFLRERVAPALVAIGDAWARGDLEIRHEHFFSEVLEDVLRGLRSTVEAKGTGSEVVLAGLPDELHALGIQVVALAIAASGRQVRIVGPNTPVDEIVDAAAAMNAAAVGISVSAFGISDGVADEVIELRRKLPSRTRLWLGGAGASELEGLPPNVEVLDTLDDLDRALRFLAS
jgi:methanogenic corrinoid protein MtbC1